MSELAEIEQALGGSPNVAKLLKSAEIAVENQTKLADSAMIAAKAFDRLVSLIEKAAAKEYDLNADK